MMAAPQQPALRGELRFDEPLSRYNTWRVGGVAQRLYLPADVSDLVSFLGTLPPREPLLWLGLGSNLLIRDGGFKGTVVLLQGRLNELRVDGTQVDVQASVACAKTARACARDQVEGVDLPEHEQQLRLVVEARPDVFNHNLETVPGLYPEVRPGARYFHSLRLLQRVKELDPSMFTKSGIMVGLGEDRQAVAQVMDDMRAADIDFLTIGQYLQPTPKHHAVDRFVHPDEFAAYEKAAYGKGFLMVSATPLTRSSYHAGDDFARLRDARNKKLGLG